VPWVLVDVAIAVLAVLLLVLACVTLWKRVRGLFRTAREASEKVGPASDALAAAQAASGGRGAYPEGTPSEERT
jgi:hypothetical protein